MVMQFARHAIILFHVDRYLKSNESQHRSLGPQIDILVEFPNLMYGRQSLMWPGISYGFGMYTHDCTGFRFSKCYNLLMMAISV